MAQTNSQRWSSLSTGQAFAIHLTLSLLIFFTLVAIMLYWWFPGELFMLDGGWQGLKLIAMVDLVLGPALTLMLYKPNKPKLALDMSLIAAFQICALAYGFYAAHGQRTVAVIHADGIFNTLSGTAMTASNEELLKLDLTPQNIKDIDAGRPPLLINPPPENFGRHLADLLNGYPEPHERSDRFLKLTADSEGLQRSVLSIEQLESDGSLATVQEELEKHNIDMASVEFYRFKTRYASGIAVYDPAANSIVDYVPVDRSKTTVAESDDAS